MSDRDELREARKDASDCRVRATRVAKRCRDLSDELNEVRDLCRERGWRETDEDEGLTQWLLAALRREQTP